MTNSKPPVAGLTPKERRAAFGLASIYASRMLGLFLILPVFALFAQTLPGATPQLVGIAIGIYGLTQAALQIPMGMLSDRVGRKRVMVGGLLLFMAGSILAALATDIWTIILGRALQGSGAIAAVVMALLADLTDESRRTRAMAMIGMTIGMSFMLALILGPLLNNLIGMSGIFWVTALLALAGMGLTIFVVPDPDHHGTHNEGVSETGLFARVLRDKDLLRLDFGIFVLHLCLTALFLALPLALRDSGLPADRHTWLYLPVLLMATAIMVPFIIKAEKGGKIRQVFTGAVALLGTAQAFLFFAVGSWLLLAAGLLFFFVAFNLLEATLPSLISKVAPAEAKGTAMGVYSTSQFSGAFVGGLLGGWVHGQFGIHAVFIMGAILSFVWLAVMFKR